MVKHKIDIGDNKPIKLPPRILHEAQRTIVDKKINDMVTTGVASPLISPFAAPLVFVMKKDGAARFCVDFRKINAITLKMLIFFRALTIFSTLFAIPNTSTLWISHQDTGKLRIERQLLLSLTVVYTNAM